MFDRSKCDLCGDCLVRCQYVNYDREEAIQQIAALVEGKEAEILRECITCCACNEYCEKGANPFDLICELQERMESLLMAYPVLVMMDKLAYHTPNEVIQGDPNKPVLSLCIMESFLPPRTFEGQLFNGLTIVKGSKYFCWIGYVHMGKESLIREHGQSFVDNLTDLGFKEIIFMHDDCYAMLTNKVKDYGIEVPFKPVHLIEYLLNYLKENRNSIIKLNKRIAYHQPCISRYTLEKEPMLDELFGLIGVERLTRRYDREDALCCGGPFIYTNPARVKKIQEMNLTDAKDHGAEAMVFLCPGCFAYLSEPVKEHDMAPIFITDLCRMALGEKPFPV